MKDFFNAKKNKKKARLERITNEPGTIAQG